MTLGSTRGMEEASPLGGERKEKGGGDHRPIYRTARWLALSLRTHQRLARTRFADSGRRRLRTENRELSSSSSAFE